MSAVTPEGVDPPEDPRVGWPLPGPGELARVSELDEVVTRVLAPNASPMTLDGTNTYVVGARGAGEVIVVDPGPDDPGHLERVSGIVRAQDAIVRHVFVTHRHADHAEAARVWARHFSCSVVAADPDVRGPGGSAAVDGDRIHVAGLEPLEVVATPGHTDDHLALRVPTGALLTGDHVLGRGTTVVTHPDGDMAAYLDSLDRVRRMAPDALYPGHGPELTEDPVAVVVYYLEHRRHRERQILDLLAEGPTSIDELVERIYADVDRALWPAARSSTRAAITALIARGEAVIRSDAEVERFAVAGPGG